MTETDMPLFTIEEVLEVTSARWLTRNSHRLRGNVRRVSTDSRDVGHGDLFIALKGEHFDGHEFVKMALQQGAVGAVVESTYRLPASLQKEGTRSPRVRGCPQSLVVLGVQDPLLAYQQLATYHRNRFNIPVVAVTGSNGKTTTKEMVACVLEERWSVLKTEGNLNNRIGVPHTLLKLAARHKAAVIEMGVDQKGQTTRLADITRPTIGLITNIGPDHLEFFGTLEASAQAKGELLDLMHPDDAVVLNADDAFFDYLASRVRCRVVSFGLSSKAQVRATNVAADERQGTTFRLALPGKSKPTLVTLKAYGMHNVSNALAAAAVGEICEMSAASIARGLSHFRAATMRSQVETRDGIRIINDCYNANPASMKAAIDLLADLGSGTRTIAVLGDMLELGPDSSALHRGVGAYLAEKDIFLLITSGPLGKELGDGARSAGMGSDRIRHTVDAGKAGLLLKSIVRRNDVVLVKASRGMRMERTVDALHRWPSVSRVPRTTVTAAGRGRKR